MEHRNILKRRHKRNSRNTTHRIENCRETNGNKKNLWRTLGEDRMPRIVKFGGNKTNRDSKDTV